MQCNSHRGFRGRGHKHPVYAMMMRGGRRGHGRGEGDGFDERGRGGRGPGGRRRMFDNNELQLMLLKLIAEQPRHGYDLIKAIEELSGGAYAPSPGVVYPTLTMLADMGVIDEQATEGNRKSFAITEEGQKLLEEKAELVEALTQRIAALSEKQTRLDAAPVRRAMMNLRQSLHDRLTAGELDKDKLHEIAAILDEAARTIERG